MVLGAGAGGQRVHAGRVAERLVLGDKGGRRAVGQHEARVEAAVLHQEGRQLAVRRVHCVQKAVVSIYKFKKIPAYLKR